MNHSTDPAPPSTAAAFWGTCGEIARARFARTFKRVLRPCLMQRLAERNRSSHESVIAPGGPVVSLTTYGPRLQNVFYVLESIGAGRLKPSRLVLWIDEGLAKAGLPDALKRLMSRGLEVRSTQDVGPHTKYFPQVLSEPHPVLPLVTADDDALYPAYWLQRLAAEGRRMPGVIHCFRAHRIAFDVQGRMRPYREWRGCTSTHPSHRHFLTGVAGVLYPVAAQNALRAAGDGFTACCPRADDIWLNLVALRAGIAVRQVRPRGRLFYKLPGTQAQGLAQGNVWGGGNDAQLLASYRVDDLQKLRSAR
ncbi:hypothetical protein V4F39_08555 [Aquincola sp. MAHUQ-54]|uniref:Glycosyltransferase n=1 Tax=Aquincola agrisoli TaxID=3119538 RepID=A0AAW9QC64_9BURK